MPNDWNFLKELTDAELTARVTAADGIVTPPVYDELIRRGLITPKPIDPQQPPVFFTESPEPVPAHVYSNEVKHTPISPDFASILKHHREQREEQFWQCIQIIFETVPELEQLAAIKLVFFKMGPPPSMETAPDHLRQRLGAMWGNLV